MLQTVYITAPVTLPGHELHPGDVVLFDTEEGSQVREAAVWHPLTDPAGVLLAIVAADAGELSPAPLGAAEASVVGQPVPYQLGGGHAPPARGPLHLVK